MSAVSPVSKSPSYNCYSERVNVAAEYFPFDFIENNSAAFHKICYSTQDMQRRQTLILIKNFVPDDLLLQFGKTCERYNDATPFFFKAYIKATFPEYQNPSQAALITNIQNLNEKQRCQITQGFLNFIKEHDEGLKKLADIFSSYHTGRINDRSLDNLPEHIFINNPESLIQVAKKEGSRGLLLAGTDQATSQEWSQHEALLKVCIECDAGKSAVKTIKKEWLADHEIKDKFLALVEIYGRNLRLVLDDINLLGLDRLDTYLNIERLYPGLAKYFVRAFRAQTPELLSENYPFFYQFLKMYENHPARHTITETIEWLPLEIISIRGGELLEVLRNVKIGEFHDTFRSFKNIPIKNGFLEDPGFFINLSASTAWGFPKILSQLKEEMNPQYKSLVLKLAAVAGPYAGTVLQMVQNDLDFKCTDKFLNLLDKWGKIYTDLIRGVGLPRADELLNNNPGVLRRIYFLSGTCFSELMKRYAGKIDDGILLPLVKRFREGTSDVISSTRLFELHRSQDPGFIQTCSENRRHFGIVNIARYITQAMHGCDFTILEENLRCLDPEHKKHLPLAVLMVARADHNSSFMTGKLLRMINNLSKHYKLMIFEVSEKYEPKRIIEFAASLHKNNNGFPSSGGVSLAILSSHSNEHCCQLGSHKRDDDRHMLRTHDTDALNFSVGINHSEGVWVFTGCSTGVGPKSITRVAKAQNKSLTFYAPKGYTYWSEQYFTTAGRIKEFEFVTNYQEESTLRLF